MPAAYEYSFIVPVYNAEKHLAECLDSLVRQGERCELVLVDDGSSDSSGKICDAYAESCERVRVFHRPNGGPAAARNFGLEHAQGAYCIFVDSDDFISADFIERLEKTFGKDKADLIFYNIEKRFVDGRSEPMAEGLKREQIAGKTPEEVLAALAACGSYEETLKQTIQQLGLQDRVHLLGFRKDVYDLLKVSDIFCFPSTREGMPVALTEAMEAELPAVASSVRGNQDLIIPGKGGYLYKAHDVNGFAEGIQKLLDDTDLRRQMGQFNKNHVKEYDIAITKNELAAIYFPDESPAENAGLNA